MIQRIPGLGQTSSWQKSLANAFTRLSDLLDFLQLDPHAVDSSEQAAAQFKCLVPKGFAERMTAGDPRDPLLLQVLPSNLELQAAPGFVDDPVGDLQANPVPGVLHKYHGRVLLITNGGCAAHCRYCFRRHFPYADNALSSQQMTEALAYIRRDKSINEVIFSGGDPLLNSDQRLSDWLTQLADIPHLTRFRIHSRLPIFLPERITAPLIDVLNSTRLKAIMVIHCNHPQEIDAGVSNALVQLHRAGITLLNQSVLLRNVNNSLPTLIALSERLFENHTLPYYLHLLDPVKGAAHFNVNESEARELHRTLSQNLPGFLVPKLVKEIPGAKSKTGLN
ncbi:MAG TPA: EF-P beta-lysylation protein EpmB [Pseudomonadales bacterium]|nr:EF-P beta-lysylation protein EpmB [Pseudomonadales bacterium]